MIVIESEDEWLAFSAILTEDGYSLSQWQYDFDHPLGFHAWFWSSGKRLLEVVTHSGRVQAAILNYRP